MTLVSNVPTDASRRNFLLGRRAPEPEGPKSALIQEHCLAQQGVVCRTCGESCLESAIRFPPRLGGVAVPLLSLEQCTGCGDCVKDCPNQAIQLISRSAPTTEAHNNLMHKGDL